MSDTQNNCLKMKTFLTILGTVITVLIVIFGFVFAEINTMDTKYDDCKEYISDIKISMESIRGDMRVIKNIVESK